jgi:asparagine synthase (glutamine-hydrolysing)
MCGITGFFDHQSNTSSEIIEKMTNTMVHRGPDGGSTILLDSNNVKIGLGHRRLAIIDLTDHGKQPMQFQNLWITFNGEIYNYKELKLELELLGHSFSSQSDT